MWPYAIAGFYAGMVTAFLLTALFARTDECVPPAGWVVDCDGLEEWCRTPEEAARVAESWWSSNNGRKLVRVRPMRPYVDVEEC